MCSRVYRVLVCAVCAKDAYGRTGSLQFGPGGVRHETT
jgi:hypothetical protein